VAGVGVGVVAGVGVGVGDGPTRHVVMIGEVRASGPPFCRM
jgi:hypothetical protein